MLKNRQVIKRVPFNHRLRGSCRCLEGNNSEKGSGGNCSFIRRGRIALKCASGRTMRRTFHFRTRSLYSRVNFAGISRRHVVSLNTNYPALGQTCKRWEALAALRNNIASPLGAADSKYRRGSSSERLTAGTNYSERETVVLGPTGDSGYPVIHPGGCES